MQASYRNQRLFASVVGCLMQIFIATCLSHAQTSKSDLTQDLNHSAFSTTSILTDLAKISKAAATEIAPLLASGAAVSSQPGNFQYDPGTRQTTSVHKLTEEIRATQQVEKARQAEITEHPFWYARFWTHSPLAIPAFLMGGDHHALETPSSEIEKLSATSYMDTNYNSEAELKKFERGVSFGNSDSGNGK